MAQKFQMESITSLNTRNKNKKSVLSIREICIFSMLGALMFASKLLMEALPNIHLVGMFVMLTTVVFRKKALISIYLYVALLGVYMGFSAWWVPNLYVWTILWAMTMLLPKTLGVKWARILYPCVCALHGLIFGIIYAPAQALLFGLDFNMTLAWIAAGFPWDCIHAAGNFIAGLMILPLSRLLTILKTSYRI